MSDARVAVTFEPPGAGRASIDEVLAPLAELTYLQELGSEGRRDALRSADAVLAWFISSELSADELRLLDDVKLLQLYSAGADRVPFERLPPGLRVAANAGAYSEPMAEHVLAMALALAKRLPQNHAAMARGEFDQQTPNRGVRGATLGVLGFGGIGQAAARLFRAVGVRVHAINRSGTTDEPVDWIGTLDDLDSLLDAADVLVVSLPLTRATRGLIGGRELRAMKPDAILVNVARVAIVDEDALYEHLRANASFSAGIDAWWQEPREGDTFTTAHPFLELPNVIGSPHNSALTSESLTVAAQRAAENIARELRGEPVAHVVDRADYA